jgi:very-short-patch-repair endonuclease
MYRDQQQREFARTLRNTATDAEKHLWQFLRAQQLRGHKFRRQAAIGPYIVDFICFPKKLIIELDENIQAVLDGITRALEKSPLPNPPLQGEGIDPK